MTATRTWLTTPAGETPVDDVDDGEVWVRGPGLPREPRTPFRYRGAAIQLVILLLAVGLTFALGPSLTGSQDPTFGAGDQQPADQDDGLVFDRPTTN